jgi:dihydroxyacid dehydratase/phosphogluconate dehydratase
MLIVKVPLCIEDFSRIADRVPLLSNLTPSGKVWGWCTAL